MATEIERKYLVVGDGWRLQAGTGQRLQQAYVLIDNHGSARVRINDTGASLTLKYGQAELSREEFEYPIPLADAEAMLKLRAGNIIDKTRFRVGYQGKLWEIDEFRAELEGLVIAEVELKSHDETVSIPPWVGAEVTSQEAYYNLSLALRGKPLLDT